MSLLKRPLVIFPWDKESGALISYSYACLDYSNDRTDFFSAAYSAMQSGLHVTNQFGGGGGGSFFDYRESADVAAIVIRSGSLIDSIKLVYRNPDGSINVGDQHGGNGGGQTIHNLAVGEFVFAIHGRTGGVVDSLSFTTNHGRVLGPHGGNGGGSFSVGNCRLRGIYGRSGSLLDAIGFVCKD